MFDYFVVYQINLCTRVYIYILHCMLNHIIYIMLYLTEFEHCFEKQFFNVMFLYILFYVKIIFYFILW